jgi:beta-lactamase regulating signal transducer with metallopeptidase domain
MPWLSLVISNVVLASLVALAAWLLQQRFRSAAVAHILWLLVLVKLLTPPLVSVPLVELPSTMACALGVCGCGHSGINGAMGGTLFWILPAAWVSGASVRGWTAWRRWTRFRRLVSQAKPAPAEWQSLAARLADELSIRCPQLLAVPGRLPPMVVPGRRPRLVLPMALIGRLDASQKVALLLHELLHIKRCDHLVRILELAVSVAYWWLPAIAFIGRQLRSCEETCCDAAVVARMPRARREYARLLLDVIDFANPLRGPAVPQGAAMCSADDLEQRLRTILGATPRRGIAWPAGMFAVCVACAVLPCQLHLGFARRTPAAAIRAERAPADGPSHSPSGDLEQALSDLACCPS